MSKDITLSLDIDQTLIYTYDSFNPNDIKLKKPEIQPAFDDGGFLIYKRPHLDEFLDFCLNTFTVGVWSQGTGFYAEEMAEMLFPRPNELAFCWGREECDPVEDMGRFVKRPSKIMEELNMPASKLIMIDDGLVHYFGQPLENLINISAWHGEPNDEELKKLQKFLKWISDSEDVRPKLALYQRYLKSYQLSA